MNKEMGNISQIMANYVMRGTIRREYASELCEMMACLQVTAVRLFCPISRDRDEDALRAEMQKCNIEIERELNQAAPYLTRKEIASVKAFRDRVFYNYQVWESIKGKIIQPWTIKYYPDDDQTNGLARRMYDRAQKYLSANGIPRLWLHIASETLILSE